MKPELYLNLISPPVRSVLLLIEELGIDVEKKNIDFYTGEHLGESYLKINPCHTVPSFRDSKVTLTDSHAILIYLCENYGEANDKLWPSDPIDRINVINKLFYSGTLLFRRDSDVMGQIIVEKIRKDEVEKHAIKIREQYGILEQFLTQHKFMATDYMTIADFSIVTIVFTIDMIVPVTAESWPKLYNWCQNMKKTLPYFDQVNQKGLATLKELIRSNTDYEIKL